MKKLFAALVLSALAIPASANQISNSITDSISLTTQGSAVQAQRIGSSYAVSGTNIKVTDNGTFGGLTGGTATAAATPTGGSYDVNTAGQAFSFSESITVGDAPASSTVSSGAIAAPATYGNTTTQSAGLATGMAGALSATGVATITAGGTGTTAVGQRTIEMSVFQ
jgi:hypothetical protein